LRYLAVALIAAVQMGGAFGEATAEVDELTEQSMIVSIEVEVGASASAVVAHLTFEGDPTVTIPLLDRGGGLFGTRTELQPKNYVVVFEAVATPGELSEPVSLVELGADLDQPFVATTAPPAGEEGLSSDTERLGWLALALGAASLSALAFWALGDRDQDEASEEATEIPSSE
jgi:hypothetical protein